MALKYHWNLSPPATVVVRSASKLSLLVGLAGSFSSSVSGESSPWSPTQRSPRSFGYHGAVGLGIVASMNDVPSPAAGECGAAAVARTPRAPAGPRSEPIPIVSARPTTGVPTEQFWSEDEDMELSESYTCVISHVGGETVRRVYVDVDVDGASDHWGGWFGAFPGSPPPARRPAPLPVADFLSRCFRCSKRLHGLDIFMYGGDKAFCSEECRCQQMISDEHREKQASDALKPFDCSLSSCSNPLLSGAAAA